MGVMKNSESETEVIRDSRMPGKTPKETRYIDEAEKKFSNFSDTELQAYLLDGVSRTFALTIPQLPEGVHKVVSNAYLLCRIIDTIEDEPKLTFPEKKRYSNRFTKVVAGKENPEEFILDLKPRLSNHSMPSEHELIALTRRVIDITHNFNEPQQRALLRCVQIMSEGMTYFQENASVEGLNDLEEMNKYCYHVAGVVGEMLTELFCLYSSKIAAHREKLMGLAVSFGQGLQMTNILKDVWDDQERSACWLPRSVFDRYNYDLKQLQHGKTTPGFERGLEYLIGVAHGHLENAMKYTLLIPREEKGIRKFCLWALGMAVLTLRKINKNRGFTSGNEVKISRRSVKATVLVTNSVVKSNRLLKILFKISRSGLPYQAV